MHRHWLVWLAVNVPLVVYFALGYVASRTEVAELKLEVGSSIAVTAIRVADGHLRMNLIFAGDRQRKALGDWSPSNDWQRTGQLRFANAGAAVRLVASRGGETATYEAMPGGGFGVNHVSRELTSDLSMSPGVWRWPPKYRDLPLAQGINEIVVKVAAVDAPLVGERVQLMIRPALGFKTGAANVGWLWFALFWQLIVPLQLLWALVLWLGGVLTARGLMR